MSDRIPFEIQIEIIKKLPVKSLIRFRSVSTTWKSLIDSSKFNTDYTALHAQHRHLLISYEKDRRDREKRFVAIMNDDTFPQHKVSLTAPRSLNLLRRLEVVGSSHGLLCFFGNNPNPRDIGSKYTAVVCNLSIRKSVAIDVPGDAYQGRPAIGFGVCPNNSDPMIVKIYCNRIHLNELQTRTCSHWKVEIFNLNSGVWKVLSSNLPSNSIRHIYPCSGVVIDRFIYWFACKGNRSDINIAGYMILSFDMISEEFKQVCLPDKISSLSSRNSNRPIFRLRESLAMVDYITSQVDNLVYDVWMMENGVSKPSFTKVFTINIPYGQCWQIVGFWKDDKVLIEKNDDFRSNDVDLLAYDPCSKTYKDVGIHGIIYSFIKSFYVESLLLLNHPDAITCDEHDGHIH